MCHLPYEKMNLIYIHSHLRGIQIAGGQLSQQEHHLFTDQHTQLSVWAEKEKIIYITHSAGTKDKGFNKKRNIFFMVNQKYFMFTPFCRSQTAYRIL